MTNEAGGIRAVVFDFGGVLITTIANQISKVAATHGIDTSVMHAVLLGPRQSGEDHPWHRAERGELAVADIQGLLGPWADRAEVTLNGDEIARLLAPGEYTVVPEMIDCIRTLRAQGLRIGLLTNTFAEFQPTMQRDIDFALFDAVIESFAVGARKPEPAIYAATVDRLSVAHDEIVYLDDFDQNLEPARDLGWQTIHVGDPTSAITELDRVLTASRHRS